MSESVILDPHEVAISRTELDITSSEPIRVPVAGIDWGDAEIAASVAQMKMGEETVDSRVPNRIIKIPLIVTSTAGTPFDTARAQLQSKVALFQRDGGWLKRVLASGKYAFADIQKAALTLGGDWQQAMKNRDLQAVLTLETLPDWYGDAITLGDHTNTLPATELDFTETIQGDYPGRVQINFDEDSAAEDLAGVGVFFRNRHYDSAATAALEYEAEHLVPLDLATVNGAQVQHTNISTTWTPVLGTCIPPSVRAVGTAASGIGDIAPALPTGVAVNDIMIMYVETANEAVNVPAGWAHTANSPVIENAGGSLTRLSILWRRFQAGDVAPKLVDPGDHQVAQIVAVRNCVTAGNPWDTSSLSTDLAVTVGAQILGVTTATDNCLILAAVGTGSDIASTTNASAWTNKYLTGLVEVLDNWAADGNGGGFAMGAGIKEKAGSIAVPITATLITADSKAMHCLALKPASSYLTHVGNYRLRAQVYPTGYYNTRLRFVYDVGDLISPTENDATALLPNGNWILVDLGVVRLNQMPVGTHRWNGQIQAESLNGGDTVSVGKIWLEPLDEGWAVLRQQPSPTALTAFTCRDRFAQTAGNLTGKVPDVGSQWFGAGDPDDFTIDTANHYAQRTAVSDVLTTDLQGGRFVQGGSTSLIATAVQMDFSSNTFDNGISQGLVLRYNTINNWAAAYVTSVQGATPATRISYVSVVGGATVINKYLTIPNLTPGQFYTLHFQAYANGQFFIWLVKQGASFGDPILKGYDSGLDANAGGALSTGVAGMVDAYASATAQTRQYDNFILFPAIQDAVAFRGRSAQFGDQGHFRQTADGAAYGPISDVSGDNLRIPVAGLEARPTQVMIHHSRGDFTPDLPDVSATKSSTKITYRPCWLILPGT